MGLATPPALAVLSENVMTPVEINAVTEAGWYAWDDAGKQYDSRVDNPSVIPNTIQAVKVWKDQITKGTRYYHVITGSRSAKLKWYVFTGSEVLDYEGTLAEAQALYPTAIIKEGTFIDDADYMVIMDKVYSSVW